MVILKCSFGDGEVGKCASQRPPQCKQTSTNKPEFGHNYVFDFTIHIEAQKTTAQKINQDHIHFVDIKLKDQV